MQPAGVTPFCLASPEEGEILGLLLRDPTQPHLPQQSILLPEGPPLGPYPWLCPRAKRGKVNLKTGCGVGRGRLWGRVNEIQAPFTGFNSFN